MGTETETETETIIIKSQEEFDNLPTEFYEKVIIRNESEETIIIKENQINSEFHNIGNSSSENYGSASTVNHDSSSSKNYDNSGSKNYDNSSSRNYDSSSSINYDSSSSVNHHNSSSINYDSSSSVNHHNSSSINFGNSSSKNFGNSSSRNYDSSSSENYGSSHSENYEQSTTHCYSKLSSVTAYDNSTVYCHKNPKSLETENSVSVVRAFIKPSFDQWIERGIICADGIKQELVSQKKIGEVAIYTTKDFEGETFYVARNGNKFSHAKTIEKAVEDLRYKIGDRDTSKFNGWKLEDTKTLEELIEAYRVITGACEEGTKLFCEGKTLSSEMTVKAAIELTKGSYGNSDFSNFFNKTS